MIKYISIIILVSLSYANSFFSEFIKFNDDFLNSSTQCINFEYKLKNSNSEFPNHGTVKLAIKEDKYILYLDYYILLVQNSVLKQYNQSTNQIFINDSNIYLDSIITQFFSLNHLKTYNNQTSDYIVIPIDLGQESLSFKFFLDEIDQNISRVESIDNNLDLSLFNFQLLDECPNPEKLFQFNYPNAFILDLRD